MALMVCRSCTTRFAVGLLRCPHCGALSELYAVPDYIADAEEENMPKISVEGGPSNALGQPAETELPTAEAVAGPVEVEESTLAESETSDETSGATDEVSAAGESADDTSEAESAPAPKPARKTAAKKAAAKQESAPKG